MKSFRKSNNDKKMRVSRRGSAKQSIGKIEKNTDTFVLTYGRFSLVDAICAILEQTGPAHVMLSTWTAAHAHLNRSVELLSSAEILSFRMIVDRSFRTRQPEYFQHMLNIFNPDCIREIRTHAKFLVVDNSDWHIVVRTSMNLNENPRMENIEISENERFAKFFRDIVDAVFSEVPAGKSIGLPGLDPIHEYPNFAEVSSGQIDLKKLKEVKYTHEIRDRKKGICCEAD